MKTLRLLAAATALIALTTNVAVHAGEPRKAKASKMLPIPQLKTDVLGGVASPSAEKLAAMQKGQYILHARAGRITKVSAQKSRLPHDPEGHIQILATALSPQDEHTVYVNQGSLMCKSTDDGRTWTSYPCGDWGGQVHQGAFQILGDGRFITVTGKEGGVRAEVSISSDEGRTWRRFSQINMPTQPRRYLYFWTYGIVRLPNGTLLCAVLASNAKDGEHGKGLGGTTSRLLAYRSTDDGKTWQGPSTVADWSGEGGIVRTASGKLLAVLRYQRNLLPDDPPDLAIRTGSGPGHYPYKHLFLADSDDDGLSWKNFRQLTTVFGQSFGFPAALDDGTVVVVRTDGYKPNRNGQAMISYDEGQTWEDEAYYIYAPSVRKMGHAGYSQSVVLADDLILTIAGTSDYGPCLNSWDACLGKSDLTAIRWKPERKEE